MSKKDVLHNADVKLIEAKHNLNTLIKELYPVGSVVTVDIGRKPVVIQITSHFSDWGAEYAYLRGVNARTGKKRKFYYTSIVD